MPTPFVIRAIVPDEWERFRRIRLQGLADAPSAFSSTLEEEARRPDAAWRERLARRDGAVFVGMREGRWLGIAGVREQEEDGSAADLVSMWVDPAARARGLGGLLVDAAVRWAADYGKTRIDLWVTETNERAIRLYASRGFVRGGERQPLASNPTLHEVVMHRPIL